MIRLFKKYPLVTGTLFTVSVLVWGSAMFQIAAGSFWLLLIFFGLRKPKEPRGSYNNW